MATLRSQYSNLYKTRRWRNIRAKQLHDFPLCKMCEEDGRVVMATVCDHIEPHKGNVDKFHAGPFQSLCKTHHDSTKARQEARGVMGGCDANGNPIDPNHPWNQS